MCKELIVHGISVANVYMYVCLGQYMPQVSSRQASLNKLIWFTLLCYLLCSGDKMESLLATSELQKTL